MKSTYTCFIIFIILSLGSCRNLSIYPSNQYASLDEIVYIENFPHVFTLDDGEYIDLDIIGALSMVIHDSLFIVTTSEKEGHWSFFTLSDYKYLGKYLKTGNGPQEFLSIPWVSQQYFFKEHNQLYSIVYDSQTANIYKMNISETLQNHKLSITPIDFPLKHRLFGFTVIDPNTFLCKDLNDDRTQQIRYFLKNGKKETNSNLEKINLASIKFNEDINILSTGTKCSPDRRRIVEVGIGLNQINLYSIDETFGKTICVGKHLDNIHSIQKTQSLDRMYRYMNVNTYPKYFSALYLNDSDINYQKGISKKPTIQFFDWDGNPLAELIFDRMITTYSIDFTTGYLYTLNRETEEIYKYNVSNILEEINSNLI